MYVVVFSAVVDCVEAHPLQVVAMDEEKRGVLVSLLFDRILHDVNYEKRNLGGTEIRRAFEVKRKM